MNITKLNDQFSVSEQIEPNILQALSDHGIEVIICNRPDNESAEQTPFAKIKEEAEKIGLTCYHIPFVGDGFNRAQVDQTADILKSGKRIHAYCRTGRRSSFIWEAAVKQL